MFSDVLIIDNYDSFVYNLAQYVGALGANPRVVREDVIAGAPHLIGHPDGVIISPGPGRPSSSKGGIAVLSQLEVTPVLGVCLGHQLIGEFFGANVVRAKTVMHGRTSVITHDSQGVFQGLPTVLTVTRYHSLVVDPTSIPETLMVTSTTADGVIMGLRHRERPIEGVQFHPESILSDEGLQMIANFLNR
ncbi:aminodeoxychorismate/anthranilate synthase component II [Ferrimicrobium sp.]|uniref:anthranilate synthase component II n=1 Tax=Ferrimicrobium sp. TaxID=2926050 RepID=UPI002611005E|nr:aminodeoxychorismate/anthranilate synthase component II [Ferrimicrobium sp.]